MIFFIIFQELFKTVKVEKKTFSKYNLMKEHTNPINMKHEELYLLSVLLLLIQTITVCAFDNTNMFITYLLCMIILHCTSHIRMKFHMSILFTAIRGLPLVAAIALYKIIKCRKIATEPVIWISLLLYIMTTNSLPYYVLRVNKYA